MFFLLDKNKVFGNRINSVTQLEGRDVHICVTLCARHKENRHFAVAEGGLSKGVCQIGLTSFMNSPSSQCELMIHKVE